MRFFHTTPLLPILLAASLVLPEAAHAYVGPGLGLGTIAVVLGVIGSIFLAIFAVLWYPIKRMLKKRKTPAESRQQQAGE